MDRKAFSFLMVLALAGGGSARAAGWEKWAGGSGNVVLATVQSPDGKNVFAAGMLMDASGGMLPAINPRVLASADGGRTWNDVSGNLANLPMTLLTAVCFVDANRGWVAGGTKVWATTNAGTAWGAPVDAGLEVRALWFSDAKHGVAVGGSGANAAVRLTADGGKTWTSPTVPAIEGALAHLFFLDAKVGWAAGRSVQTIGDPPQDYEAPKAGYVLATTDGGQTWSTSTSVPDYGLGPVFFLRDGKTGWAAGYKMVDSKRSDAALFKSLDGGKTWADAKLPLDVATISMMGFTGRLNASFFGTVFFASDKVGHLGGAVYLADSQEGGSSPTKIFRVVDFWTQDGTTWTRTDLGTVAMTPSMQNDGALAGGSSIGLAQGWMVGEKSLVWGYNAQPPMPCKADAECAPGFGCNPFGKCVSVTCPDGCPAGEICVWAVCRMPPDAGAAAGGDGAVAALDDAGQPVVVGDGGALAGDGGTAAGTDAGTAGEGGGCGCAAGAGAAPLGFGLLLAALSLRRRARAGA